VNASAEGRPEVVMTQEKWEGFQRVTRNALDLCALLQADFLVAWHRVTESDFEENEARALVRCFGSLLDGLTTGMRGIAVATCKLFNRPLNPFLQDKVEERTITSYHLIFTSYRLIGEFLPGSPLSSISDQVWNELRKAIEIRNRIMHPKETRDMTLSSDETIAMRTGKEFHELFNKFHVWFMEKQQKLVMPHVVTYRRMFPKPGRNKPCPCGSDFSYKDCCFKATAVTT
jgi:hypothetical protein